VYKIIILMFLSFSSNVFASENNTLEELTASLEKTRIENNIPSLAVAIISSGEVTYIKGFGFLDEIKTKPTSEDTLFRIASISKLFTAQAIMQLVQNDKLDLSDKVGKYLPTLAKNNITIKQLLTHSSGLSDIIRPVTFEEKRTISSYLGLVSKSAPKHSEEQAFEYSDTNFNILGAIINAVTGQEYEKFVHDNILKPAQMKKSNYSLAGNEYFAEASPTYKGKLIDKTDQRPYDVSFNPSEGLVSNVRDLSHWLKLTLARDASILEEQTYNEMLEPQIKTTWGEIYMALGWQVYKTEHGKVARHPGSIRGYKSLVLTYPESKNAMILLTNSSNTPRWEIAKSITEILRRNSEW